MRSRRNVFLTITMAAALWAWSGGVASAQAFPPGCGGVEQPPCICGGVEQPACPPPGGIVTCTPPGECLGTDCPPSGFFSSTCLGLYSPDQSAHVFTFGDNNSINIKFPPLSCSFALTVQLNPTTQEEFRARVAQPPDGVCPALPPAPINAAEVECNETVGQGACAVYSVSTVPAPLTGCYTGDVNYTIGWLFPKVGNKHYYAMLRDPDNLDPNDDGFACFKQNITFGGVDKQYVVGTLKDPGLGGRACCPSDYVVARQKLAPGQIK
jgi:hypothetical protein